MFDNWYIVYAVDKPVAAFPNREDAEDHANALRDVVGEARGLTSAFSIKHNKVWHFRYYTKNHGAIVSTVCAISQRDAENVAWCQVLQKYDGAIYLRHEVLN